MTIGKYHTEEEIKPKRSKVAKGSKDPPKLKLEINKVPMII